MYVGGIWGIGGRECNEFGGFSIDISKTQTYLS